MSKKLPSKVKVNGIAGKPASPTAAPGGSWLAARATGRGARAVRRHELHRAEVDVLALRGLVELVDHRRDVVVSRHGLAELGDGRVVGLVAALGLLSGRDLGLGVGQTLLLRRDLLVEIARVLARGRHHEEPEGPDDGRHHDDSSTLRSRRVTSHLLPGSRQARGPGRWSLRAPGSPGHWRRPTQRACPMRGSSRPSPCRPVPRSPRRELPAAP